MQLVKNVMTAKRNLVAVAALLAVMALIMAMQPPPASAAEPRLRVGWVECLVETNESPSDSDEVYMVLFRGFTTAPFSSAIAVRGPGNYWTDFDAGELRNQDIDIAGWSADSVYVVMLVEQDSGTDVTGSTLDLMKTAAALSWSSQMLGMTLANNGGPITAQQKATAAQAVGTAMKGVMPPWPAVDPDDVIGTKQLVITPGQIPLLDFFGDGGFYRVRFKIV